MAFNQPTIDDFKNYFVRDFAYNSDPTQGVTDTDISNALFDAGANMNPDLWGDQLTFGNAFLQVTAHFLVMNIRASTQGLNSQFTFLQNSKSDGSLSEGIAIPQRILDNPELAMYAKTHYGAKFLMMIIPQLSGQVLSVCGGTNY